MEKTSKTKIGIIGYGNFSKFIVPHLAKHAEVYIYGRADKKLELENILNKNIKAGSESDLANLDYLILSVPLNGIEEVCKFYKDEISKKTIIADVTSVKVKPLKLIQKYFKGYKILGTHPIFGPQSGKDGLKDLPMVLSNVSLSDDEYLKIKTFLSEKLKLKIIEKTPEKHDEEMAYIQGLSHFIGRALSVIDIKDFETATKSYGQLLNLKDLLRDDSWELYKTIQNGNPKTVKVRKDFLKVLNNLETKLSKEK